MGNVCKQGFQVFDRYTIFATPLPLAAPLPLVTPPTPFTHSVQARPVSAADKALFRAMEAATSRPDWLEIQGSSASRYFASFWDSLLGKLSNGQSWVRAFAQEGIVVGFLAVNSSGQEDAGTISRPLIADAHFQTILPIMLQEASAWLTSLKKTQIRLIAPDNRPQLTQYLQENGWQPTQSWVRLVKQLPITHEG